MAKVSERRLRKLEWAALDARTRRRWGAFLRERGVSLAEGLAEMRRRYLVDGLGLWSPYEQQLAAQAGCTVAELRREGARIVAETEAPRQPRRHPPPAASRRALTAPSGGRLRSPLHAPTASGTNTSSRQESGP